MSTVWMTTEIMELVSSQAVYNFTLAVPLVMAVRTCLLLRILVNPSSILVNVPRI
jgi:hypothetical protein